MKKRKQKLYIITMHFPYGVAEKTFVEPELKLLAESDKFDITIISNAKTDEQTTVVDDNIKVIRIPYKDVYKSPKACIRYGVRFITSKCGWKEIGLILKSEGKKAKRLLNSIWFYMQSSYFADELLENVDISDGIIYTYWFHTQSMGILLNKKKFSDVKMISRIHRFDLYNEANTFGRQPFKWYMDEKIDKLFFIAEEGKEYYQRNWGSEKYNEKYEVQRLGIFCDDSYETIIAGQKKNKEFLVVSCSNMIPVKRVELIIESLAHISGFDIKWIHFGDGVERKKLEKKAFEKLGGKKNIIYDFKGHTNNREIMEFYKCNYVDCFITTSASEGCPVSIQEALAYGIPIIATDVGEIPFMMNNNGILVDKNSSVLEIADAIKSMYMMPQIEKEKMRKMSRKVWEENFNGYSNYRTFIRHLLEL